MKEMLKWLCERLMAAEVDGKLEAAGNFKVASGTKAVVAVSKVGKAVASVRFTLK